MRTWRTVAWRNEPPEKGSLLLTCEGCGIEALCECAAHGPTVIASLGLRLILDPPDATVPENFLPDEIACRYCRRTYSANECGAKAKLSGSGTASA